MKAIFDSVDMKPCPTFFLFRMAWRRDITYHHFSSTLVWVAVPSRRLKKQEEPVQSASVPQFMYAQINSESILPAASKSAGTIKSCSTGPGIESTELR
jgi:hypothetical protein